MTLFPADAHIAEQIPDSAGSPHGNLHESPFTWCAIVPTYNNGRFLEDFLNKLCKVASDIIVVNDGSTDNTKEILSRFEDLKVISFTTNKGKGTALKAGFAEALNMGFDYAVTIDSDGQHHPEDIPLFVSKIKKIPGSFIIGAREKKQPNRRKGSNFANKFSNFWFKFITGITLPDTQSGFRLYPLSIFREMKFFTGKYEFELEVLVRAIWKGIPVSAVPVNVTYREKEKQVSHFRPFRDFSRISLLYTFLVLAAIIWVKPFSFVRYLNKENIREFLVKQLIQTRDSLLKTSLSVGFGVFMGIVPIWGYQLITAIALAHLMKLNKFIVIVAANISIPPMIPFILYLSYVTGGLVLNSENHLSFRDTEFTFDFIKDNLYQYVVGSLVFALVMGILFWVVTYYLLRIFRKKPV